MSNDAGDLTNFFKETSIVDQEWLDVDAVAYREDQVLPEQNYDAKPNLESLWRTYGDAPPSNFVPNRADMPKSLAELDARQKAEEEKNARFATKASDLLIRTARLALMQSGDLARMRQALVSRFDVETIQANKTHLAAVLNERGLLGPYYVAATDFPQCAQGLKVDKDFIRRFAANASYLLQKAACGGCCHNSNGSCNVINKPLVAEVPYTEDMASAVESFQRSSGKNIQASVTDPKERIRAAFLANDVSLYRYQSVKPIENPVFQMKPAKEVGHVHLKVLQNERAALTAAEQAWVPLPGARLNKLGFDVREFLRREMLKGLGQEQILSNLRMSFDVGTLRETRASWEPLFNETGLYGSLYTTQGSFDECSAGSDFLARNNPGIKAVVAGDKCQGCYQNKMGRCLTYHRPLVASVNELFTDQAVKDVLWEQKTAGRLPSGAETLPWGSTQKEALQNIYRTASTKVVTPKPIPGYATLAVMSPVMAYVTSSITKRNVVRTASRYLNEGLYGKDLGTLLQKQFDPRDILASKDELKTILGEQGLQGVYFIDPTIYEDYGRCAEGGAMYRTKQVPYVKLGSKCFSCVHQPKTGHCSQYNKPLVKEPPYLDKSAQQKAVLDSGKSTETNFASLVNHKPSMLAQLEMQAAYAASSTIELNPEPTPQQQVTLEVGGRRYNV